MSEFNMKAVLRQTGLTAETLRAWERRYGAVRPKRTATGRRYYSTSELQRLKLLRELVGAGHSISQIAPLKDSELIKLIHLADESKTARAESAWSAEVQSSLDAVMTAVDAFDLSSAQRALARLRFQLSPREFAFRIVPEIMLLLGSRIDEGRISIAQEHALSEVIQTHLRRIYEDLESQGAGRGEVPSGSLVFCTREGDPHDLALFMAAIACRYRGFHTHFLGKNLPSRSLVEAALRLKPRAVVLGLAWLPSGEEKITSEDYLKEVTAKLPAATELWLGGSATRGLKLASLARKGREIWVFESMDDLEARLGSRA